MDEKFVQNIICRLPRTEGIAFDIGANHGMYTYEMALRFSHVYSFEAHPLTVKNWMEPVVGKLPNVTIVPKAVTGTNGPIKLYYNDWDGMATINKEAVTLPGNPWNRSLDQFLTVEGITLDSFCRKQKITNIKLIKCDIEGGEDMAFEGAIKTLQNNNPLIVLEVHQCVNYKRLFNLFKDLGYNSVIDEYEQMATSFVPDTHYRLAKWLPLG